MKLSPEQIKFTQLIGILIQFAYMKGYGLSFGCARCVDKNHHKKNSLHYIALAIDFNLFRKSPSGEWVWLAESQDHLELGEFWESLDKDCRWGGRFDDGNHYSLEHGGMR